MALPRPASKWTGGMGLPSRLFERAGGNDYELHEQDGEFVLTVELPGFDPAELNIAGEHEDEFRDTRRTYHRRFRFPKTVDEDDIQAEYENGVLSVRLPIAYDTAMTGTEIEIES